MIHFFFIFFLKELTVNLVCSIILNVRSINTYFGGNKMKFNFKVNRNRDVNVGDVIWTANGDVYMIILLQPNSMVSLLDLSDGCTIYQEYETVDELMDSFFDVDDNIRVISSNNVEFKEIGND